MKKIKILWLVLWPSLVFSQGNTGQVTQGLSVLAGGLWPNNTCEVCWENAMASNATERAWVRDAVASTWERESDFRFTGWGNCNAQSRGIRIQIKDERPHTVALGSNLDGVANGMVLNFTFMLWGSSCSGTREYCIKAIGVHEFGHALGFAHEQNRKDAPLDCQLDAQGGDGDWWVTTYDESSIMNYCNPAWNNDGFLSDKDKVGVRFLYGGKLIEDPIIYALDPSGKLLWYKHSGYWTGAFEWAPASGATVGSGWGSFERIFSDGDGYVYAIQPNGDLLWYNHNGFHKGTFEWSATSGRKVGNGWGGVRTVFAAGKGVIYIIKENGDLIWYKHTGYQDGTMSWDAKSGTKVGNGWTDYYAVFSGGLGVIYMIKNNGDLVWYKHAGYADGSYSWYGGNNNVVGSGWNSAKQVFSTGWGNIYLVDGAGKLRFYNHKGFNNGTATWGPGTGNTVGSGWNGLKTIGLGGQNPSPIQIKDVIGLDIKYFNH
ncbi:MAG: tachylectin-related carbohydrate-binding protein [Bacteroidia bacterium]